MNTIIIKALFFFLCCCLLAFGATAWADVTASPSGAIPDVNGVLTPQTNDTVTVDSTGGTNVVSIDNEAAEGVTVNLSGELEPANTKNAINLGAGATININGDPTTSIVKSIDAGDGTIAIQGAGNTITNNGTIESVGGEAIEGNLLRGRTDGTVLNNNGIIKTVFSIGNSVNLNVNALVTNSGQILYEGDRNHRAVSVGNTSTVNNSGTIEAKEVLNATSKVIAVSLGGSSTLNNTGTIRVIGDNNDSAGRGVAVSISGTGASIDNSGTIDASTGELAIDYTDSGAVTIDNSGTIIGGSRGAIFMSNSEASELILKTGSQITGDVLARVLDRTSLRKTDAELGSQTLIDFCNQNPSESFCFKIIPVLPQNTTLTLQGTGTEDDRLTGFNQIDKSDAGAWTIGADFQAGSATDFYQTGDFRDTLSIDVQDAAGQLNLTGNITDNGDGTKGSLVKNGEGRLSLSGNNTYSGTTTINDGELLVSGGNGIGDNSAVTVASGAFLSLGSGETIGSLAGAGSVNVNGQSLKAGGDNSSTTYSGAINGAGNFEKFGTGILTLSGTSTSTGSLLVQEGTLDAAGSISMVTTVGTLATLKGSGTLGRLTNLGRVAPGNSVGVLNVSGNYFQDASGTLEIEIATDGSAADQLAVGGNVVLAGTLAVKGENGGLLTPAVGGQTYTIITAGSSLTDQFGSAPPLGAFTFQPTYNANDVQLGVTYTGFTPIQQAAATIPVVATAIPGAGTTNQVTKATALDKAQVTPTGFNSGNADFDQVLLEIANETADELANTYNNIIAEPYAAYMTVLLEQNDFFAETVLDRAQICSVSGRGSLGGDFTLQSETADGSVPVGCGSSAGDRPHGAWVDATWVKGDVDGDDGLSGYDYRITGLVAGVDTAFGRNFAGGVAVGYGQPELDSYDLADAEIDGDSYFMSTYGTYTQNLWEFAGMLGYTYGEYESDRRIRFGSIDRTARGDFDSDGVIASAKAAYFYKINDYDLVPEFGLTYSKIWQDGFTEKDADSLNLKVADADAYSVVTSAGMRLGTVIEKGETRFRPHALVRYEYDWNAGNDEDHDLRASFAEVPIIESIDVVGQNRGENGVVLSGGLTVQITEHVDIFGDGGYRWHDNGDEYTFSAGARMTW